MKNTKDVTMYITPNTFGSVVLRYPRNRLPRGCRTGGNGRETTECGAAAVISTPSDHVEDWPGTRPGAPAGCRGPASRACFPSPFFKGRFPLN